MRAPKLIIPAPPAWLFWGILVFTMMAWLIGCSYPLRFDPNRQDQQWKQDQCLAKGGSPQECRP